jgi:hypothetical protein
LMLDCERWTLTHSSVSAVLSAVGLGLAVMKASRLAVALLAVAEVVARDGDGEAGRDDEAEPDGEALLDDEAEPDGEALLDDEAEPDSEGEAELDVGPALDLVGSAVGLAVAE